ncbi:MULTISPECIES: hypothetical protein [unclassified Paenibacillus]|nr:MULTISPECIES: hypothetical protein [unclassified Paenibacillus]MDF9843232.1 hypothetical protein [Paenibacillus sp. PastF-2]MDF9849820.1 hypothetical protein [Paenibacillus sp. PastM-2]MDF9856527.1 hypothetical protein [Paenibacillus sp. PastF-1]MDH6481797.1 hypothetical protein [Paenibacillus sp. PastH-2]
MPEGKRFAAFSCFDQKNLVVFAGVLHFRAAAGYNEGNYWKDA